MGRFFVNHKYDRHQVALYLGIVIASLLLHVTNAATNGTEDNEGLLATAQNYYKQVVDLLPGKSNENSTTVNQTSNENGTTTTSQRTNRFDFRTILSITVRLLSQALIIFGGVLPYIPQYLIIKRKQNAEGFSNYVCLTLLVANIIRIEFWFGKHFEIPLLIQSIVMILCMLIMLELWTRIHALTMRRQLDTEEGGAGSKEILTDEFLDKKFTDFEVDYFWRWTTFASYLQFLFLITFIFSIMTWLLLKNVVYIETIGFLAVVCEALLGIPQFVRNFRLKSTEGMSVKMVLLWASGDIFKTVYFIIRNAPKQFWLCGILQISIDVAILFQVMLYSNKYRFRQQ
ncbi:unnamed protein product [Adineta ricciae]|uniref:Solute carrier family 66 member 2 n=1 Tax=Adineta ricciae TaxID=249248 RepID=A0A813Q9H1_ADIRI|nr:unnamed protein product [Adineta ricciae]